MKKIAIPSDIKSYSQANTIKLIAKWLGFTLLISIVIFFINVRADQLKYKSIPVYITVFLLILPFFITKAYKLFDKSWVGTIEKIEPNYHIEYDGSGYTKWNFSNKTFTEKLVLYIRTTNGKIKVYNAHEHSIAQSHEQTSHKPSEIMEHYQVGDTVIHIKGTRFLQVVEKEQSQNVCVVCGNLENSENENCSRCGHTLKIKKNTVIHY